MKFEGRHEFELDSDGLTHAEIEIQPEIITEFVPSAPWLDRPVGRIGNHWSWILLAGNPEIRIPVIEPTLRHVAPESLMLVRAVHHASEWTAI